MKVEVVSGQELKTFKAKKGENLLELLAKNGYFITALCGGKGTCKKCKVRLISGEIHGAVADENGFVLSCKAIINGDVKVEVFNATGNGLTRSNVLVTERDIAEGYGIAVDIGTTTLAFYLMDLQSGKEIENYSCLNPQGVYGGDVLSRISACEDGHLNELNKLIIDKTAQVIEYFKSKHNISVIKKMTVCGNTTMMHLFAGVDASPLGKYPFTPVFLDKKEYAGKSLNLDIEKVVLLPGISSYVGSDISAGILSTGLYNDNKNKILIDIGTNGEIALNNNGKLKSASTAAGPAFEGANITCGMGGVEGALDSASYIINNLSFSVINNGKAKGICGSGLIDIIAIMAENNIIDETGTFNEDVKDKYLAQKIKDDKFYLTEDVFISQKDVREFQLAKSAICAGIKTIVKESGLTLEQIDNILIAGGLGFYINQQNAVKTGLIPKELLKKIVVVGNSAGAGAIMCLLSEKKLKECEDIALKCQNIELSISSLFMEEYIDNMSF